MARPLLSLESIRVMDDRGGRARAVLSDITFELQEGEQFGIWGGRYCGKSTLLAIAGGRLTPHAGKVRFMGRDFAEMSEGEQADVRRKEIGWVQRVPPQMEFPLLDWVALAAPEDAAYRHREHEAAELLDRFGIENNRLGLRWSELTDGERALAGIANALIRKPRLLIADDPTTALDLGERDRVTLMLRLLADEQRIAMLMSAPDMGTLKFFKRFGNLHNGRMTEARVPDEPGAQVIPLAGRRGASGQ